MKFSRQHPSSPRRRAGRMLGTVGFLLLVQAVLVCAFVLPGYKPEPHHVPVGVVGPPAAAEALEAEWSDEFTVTQYASESAARVAIEEREVYARSSSMRAVSAC